MMLLIFKHVDMAQRMSQASRVMTKHLMQHIHPQIYPEHDLYHAIFDTKHQGAPYFPWKYDYGNKR